MQNHLCVHLESLNDFCLGSVALLESQNTFRTCPTRKRALAGSFKRLGLSQITMRASTRYPSPSGGIDEVRDQIGWLLFDPRQPVDLRDATHLKHWFGSGEHTFWAFHAVVSRGECIVLTALSPTLRSSADYRIAIAAKGAASRDCLEDQRETE